MKSMKKIVSLALCTAMLGSAISGMNLVAAETTGKTEFWNDKMANTDQSKLDQMQESIKDLSGIDVELIAYPDTASYQTAMQQSIRTEDAPGLFTWWSGSQLETLVNEGLVEDMTDFWDEYVIPNGVSADVAGSLTFDGKIYGVPYSIIYNTIIYNKDIFNQYGLEEPQTFDEFLTVCQTLLDNGVTPIALKSDSWAGFIWFQAMLAAYDPALYEGVCDGSIAYTKNRFDKADGKKSFSFVRPNGEKGLGDKKPVPYNLPEVIRAQKVYFVEGEKCADAVIQARKSCNHA